MAQESSQYVYKTEAGISGAADQHPADRQSLSDQGNGPESMALQNPGLGTQILEEMADLGDALPA